MREIPLARRLFHSSGLMGRDAAQQQQVRERCSSEVKAFLSPRISQLPSRISAISRPLDYARQVDG